MRQTTVNLFVEIPRLRANIVVSAILVSIIFYPHLPLFAQTSDEVLKSYVGQKLILRRFGKKRKVNIDAKNLSKRGGGCDVAVEVREAEFIEGKPRLRLEHIGDPMIPSKKVRSCGTQPVQTVLTVSGVREQDPANALLEMLAQIIQTPEAYLIANGVNLRSHAAQIGAPVVELPNSSNTPPGVTAARPVLIVYASYSDEARQKRARGTVKLAIDVGTNGVIRTARILEGVDPSLDRQALRVLPLWRFQPGLKDGKAVIVRTEIETIFRLF